MLGKGPASLCPGRALLDYSDQRTIESFLALCDWGFLTAACSILKDVGAAFPF